METQEEIVNLIVYVSVLIVILVVFVITFFLAYQRRKTQLLVEKAEQKRFFEEELARTQTEIQEQTFKNISWELHDNIGQLLSVANMQFKMMKDAIPEDKRKSYEEAADVLSLSLKEVRQLSHSLNTDIVSRQGFQESLENEVERFKRLNFLRVEYDVKGTPVKLNRKDEIIIFRIFQECFSNVVKYSRATLLSILVKYLPQELFISATDNGVGFDPDNIQEGAGLINMKKRAELIGADFSITTSINEGVSVTLKYPYRDRPTEE